VVLIIWTDDNLLNSVLFGKFSHLAVKSKCSAVYPDCTGVLGRDLGQMIGNCCGISMSSKCDFHNFIVPRLYRLVNSFVRKLTKG